MRTARGYVQEEVAERAGVSSEFYARIERGHALPSVRTFCRLIAILDVSADHLLGLDKARDGPDGDDELDKPVPYKRRGSRQEQREKKIVRRLRSSSPRTLHLVTWVLRELDRAARSSS